MDVISIGAPLARLFEDALESRILARFDSTLQIETRDGTLWAITARSNAGAMRIVAPIVPQWRDGANVRVRDGKILAGDVELEWNSRALFDPHPRVRALNATERRRAAQNIAGALARWQLPDALGFWNELSEMWGPFAQSIIPLPSPLAKGGGGDRLGEFVSRLIGRGPGLTPTGDDFLQALLVTVATGDEADRAAFQLLACAIKPHLARTPRVSRAFLEEGMQGWAFGALKDVLDALPLVTEDKLNALLSIGASSGPAYGFGILMGLSWDEN